MSDINPDAILAAARTLEHDTRGVIARPMMAVAAADVIALVERLQSAEVRLAQEVRFHASTRDGAAANKREADRLRGQVAARARARDAANPSNSAIRGILLEFLAPQDLLDRAPCGDNSCMFGPPGGMGTNGGCRCFDRMCELNDPQIARSVVRRLAWGMREMATRIAAMEADRG